VVDVFDALSSRELADELDGVERGGVRAVSAAGLNLTCAPVLNELDADDVDDDDDADEDSSFGEDSVDFDS
jgi:hypothetical protein